MIDDVKHMSDGWKTMCGKTIHFDINVIPVAASLRSVTCPKCRAAPRYKKALRQLENEITAIKGGIK